MKTAAEWRAWNFAETDIHVASRAIQEIIADYAACERERNDLLKAEKEMWSKDFRDIQRERDEWKAMADKGATTLVEYAAEKEKAEDEREEMRHACLTRDEMHWETTARYEAELKRLRNALQALYDEQNGPPLIRHEARWQAAMDEAERLIAETQHPTVTEGGTQ